jgi:hypothetical protein
VQQTLELFGGSNEGEKTLVVGLDDASIIDAGVFQPAAHLRDSLTRRRKRIRHLLSSPVLAIIGRIWMRAGSRSAIDHNVSNSNHRHPCAMRRYGGLTHPLGSPQPYLNCSVSTQCERRWACQPQLVPTSASSEEPTLVLRERHGWPVRLEQQHTKLPAQLPRQEGRRETSL